MSSPGSGVLLPLSLASALLLSWSSHATINSYTVQNALSLKIKSKEQPVAVLSAADKIDYFECLSIYYSLLY